MRKRANGEGSYSYDEINNCWVWRIMIKGKITKISSKSRKQLKARVEEYLNDLKNYQNMLAGNATLKEWCLKWLELVRPTIKIKTYDYYSKFVNNYIIPHLGDYNLKNLKQMDVQNFINQFTVNTGIKGELLSATSINGIRRTLKTILESAKDNGMIRINPVTATKPVRKQKKEVIVLDKKQLQNLLKEAESGEYIYYNVKQKWNEDAGMKFLRHCYYYAIFLDAYTGMRQGELFGLKWDDIDWQTNYISIKQNMQYTSEGLIFTSPKNDFSIRKILIDRNTMGKLKVWRKEQEEYAKQYAGAYNNTLNLVFTNSFGKPVSVTNFSKRYWHKLLGKINAPEDFTFHCLRHTHATLLLMQGVNVKIVSQRLGHNNVTTTLNIYCGWIPDMQQEAVKEIEKMHL